MLIIFPRPSNGLLCMFSDLCFICFLATVTIEPGLCWKWQIISCFAWAKLFVHEAENVSTNPEAGPFSSSRHREGKKARELQREANGGRAVEEWKAKASAMQMGALQP